MKWRQSHWQTLSNGKYQRFLASGTGQSPEGRRACPGEGKHHLDIEEQNGEGTLSVQEHFPTKPSTVPPTYSHVFEGAR